MTKGFIIFTLAIITAVAGGVYIMFEQIKESGYESCVLSIESALGQALADDPEFSQKIPVTNEWRTLGEEEERVLFDKLIAAGRTFDCEQFGEYANGDALRGEKGRINVRKDGQRVRVRIEVNDGRTRITNPVAALEQPALLANDIIQFAKTFNAGT
jgi:hypothetical protein